MRWLLVLLAVHGESTRAAIAGGKCSADGSADGEADCAVSLLQLQAGRGRAPLPTPAEGDEDLSAEGGLFAKLDRLSQMVTDVLSDGTHTSAGDAQVRAEAKALQGRVRRLRAAAAGDAELQETEVQTEVDHIVNAATNLFSVDSLVASGLGFFEEDWKHIFGESVQREIEDDEPADQGGNTSLALADLSGTAPKYAYGLWPSPNPTYRYCFNSDVTAGSRATFEAAVKHIEGKVGADCVKFRNVGLRSTDACNEGPYSVIKRHQTAGYGGGQATPGLNNGRHYGGNAWVKLGDKAPTGVTIHETLHSLGFIHEQSRADRDQYITMHFENIVASSMHNWKKMEEVQELPYDYNSIMHYGTTYFSKDGRSPSFTTKGGQSTGQRMGMSDLDVRQFKNMYCPDGQQWVPTPAPTPNGALWPVQPGKKCKYGDSPTWKECPSVEACQERAEQAGREAFSVWTGRGVYWCFTAKASWCTDPAGSSKWSVHLRGAEPKSTPTPHPTPTPTPHPTPRPTAHPTPRPTAHPTPRPTAHPTPAPETASRRRGSDAEESGVCEGPLRAATGPLEERIAELEEENAKLKKKSKKSRRRRGTKKKSRRRRGSKRRRRRDEEDAGAESKRRRRRDEEDAGAESKRRRRRRDSD